MKQAEEIMSPIRTPSLVQEVLCSNSYRRVSKNTTVLKLVVGRQIRNPKFLTGSILEVRPMSIAKLQGRHDKVATADEWLSCDIRETLSAQ